MTPLAIAAPADVTAPPQAEGRVSSGSGQFATDDYKIGPQDLLEIQVYGIEGLKREARVNWRGVISLPLIGLVEVGGLTAEQAEALIAARYEKDYLQNPQVSLFVREFTSQRITVEGAVTRPGIFPLKGRTSLLQAIALAGGQGALPEMTDVLVFRTESGERKMYSYDVIKIRAGELPDPPLQDEDMVVVKRVSARVAVRDSFLGDLISIFNPFYYFPRY